MAESSFKGQDGNLTQVELTPDGKVPVETEIAAEGIGEADDAANTDATTSGSLIAFIKGLVSILKGVASGAADTGNPVKVGGKYNATPPTLDDGDRGDLQQDVNANLKTTLATGIAGEDLTNNVLVTEQRYSYSYQATAGDNKVIKASAGFLHAIIIGTWVDNGVIELSDHASDGDGSIVLKITGNITDDTNSPVVIPIDAVHGTGICADIVNFTDVTFIYR